MKFLDYIQGLRKGKDAHRIEHEAMTDPFLSDAIDGFDSIRGNHSERIAGMQAYIQKRAVKNRNKSGVWKISIAAVVFIALLGGYFSLLNHQSAMMVACESCGSYITIYAPEGYIERKGIELAELQKAGKDTSGYLKSVVDIVNLHEVIKPIERINIYMPDVHYAQLSEKEIRELTPIHQNISTEESVLLTEVPAAVVPAKEILDITIPEDAPLVAEKVSAAETDSKAVLEHQKASESLQLALSGRVGGIQIQNSQQGAFYDRSVPSHGESVAKPDSKKILKGKIVDRYNEPLIGVTVLAKGTNKATVTDMDGNYYLNIDSAKDAALVANYIGYETIEIPKAKDNQVIAMKESQQVLDEVVVTGYGTQKKSSMTGSVATIKSDKVKETKPKPLIGDKAYKKYLEESLIRPENSTGCKKGKVILEFSVNSAGRPTNISVVKSLCEPFDKEAIRLLEAGSGWTQGTSRVKVEIKF